MLKNLSSIALILSCSVYSAEQSVSEYTGKIANLYIGKTSTVKVGVVPQEDNLLNCELNDDNKWPLYFEQGQSYSKEWFDVLNLVRRTQETIRIGYIENTEDSCAIEYLALLKSDGTGSNGESVGDSISRHGQYGNIALIYTNNLTDSSFSASNHKGADVAAAAFDGYMWQDQIEEDLGSIVNRGIWVVEKDKENDEQEYWLQVEFERIVDVTGFRIMVNGKSAQLGRGPRGITILTSINGDDFVESGSYKLSKSIDQRANLNTKTELKYFRVRVDSNYGDSHIEIDELEVYSN